MVEVVEGQHAGSKGTIKHIDRTTLFLHTRTHTQNSGIFPVRARSALLAGRMNRSQVCCVCVCVFVFVCWCSCSCGFFFVVHVEVVVPVRWWFYIENAFLCVGGGGGGVVLCVFVLCFSRVFFSGWFWYLLFLILSCFGLLGCGVLYVVGMNAGTRFVSSHLAIACSGQLSK